MSDLFAASVCLRTMRRFALESLFSRVHHRLLHLENGQFCAVRIQAGLFRCHSSHPSRQNTAAISGKRLARTVTWFGGRRGGGGGGARSWRKKNNWFSFQVLCSPELSRRSASAAAAGGRGENGRILLVFLWALLLPAAPIGCLAHRLPENLSSLLPRARHQAIVA